MIPSPRFKVVETDGFEIGAERSGRYASPMLSVSVLDSAYCYREVAQFSEETELRKWRGRYYLRTKVARREALRNRAAGLAAMLEADCA